MGDGDGVALHADSPDVVVFMATRKWRRVARRLRRDQLHRGLPK
jgi:uridine kinase